MIYCVLALPAEVILKMINISDDASEKIQQALIGRGKGLGIRISVHTTGCSGLAYRVEFVDNPLDDVVDYEDPSGFKVYVSPKDMPYLNGLTMVWKSDGLKQGMDFINPNERDRCGCGESFRV
jgi:iron-sulfur cluster assembly protein